MTDLQERISEIVAPQQLPNVGAKGRFVLRSISFLLSLRLLFHTTPPSSAVPMVEDIGAWYVVMGGNKHGIQCEQYVLVILPCPFY